MSTQNTTSTAFKALTDREKALISFAACQQLTGTKPDWKQIYLLSRDKAVKSIPIPASFANNANVWKNSVKVADYFRAEFQRLEAWKTTQQDNAISDYIAQCKEDADLQDSEDNITLTNNGGGVEPKFGASSKAGKNYAERVTMLSELNKIAREAKDTKEKLDALKIIADLQRFKDTATTEKPEIKRFYMPLRCSDCEIYKRRKESLNSDCQ